MPTLRRRFRIHAAILDGKRPSYVEGSSPWQAALKAASKLLNTDYKNRTSNTPHVAFVLTEKKKGTSVFGSYAYDAELGRDDNKPCSIRVKRRRTADKREVISGGGGNDIVSPEHVLEFQGKITSPSANFQDKTIRFTVDESRLLVLQYVPVKRCVYQSWMWKWLHLDNDAVEQDADAGKDAGKDAREKVVHLMRMIMEKTAEEILHENIEALPTELIRQVASQHQQMTRNKLARNSNSYSSRATDYIEILHFHRDDDEITIRTDNIYPMEEHDTTSNFYGVTWPRATDISLAKQVIGADLHETYVPPCLELNVITDKIDCPISHIANQELVVVFQLYFDERKDQLKFHVKTPEVWTPNTYLNFISVLRSKMFMMRLQVLLSVLMTHVLPAVESPDTFDNGEIMDKMRSAMLNYQETGNFSDDEEENLQAFQPAAILRRIADYTQNVPVSISDDTTLVPLTTNNDDIKSSFKIAFRTASKQIQRRHGNHARQNGGVWHRRR